MHIANLNMSSVCLPLQVSFDQCYLALWFRNYIQSQRLGYFTNDNIGKADEYTDIFAKPASS